MDELYYSIQTNLTLRKWKSYISTDSKLLPYVSFFLLNLVRFWLYKGKKWSRNEIYTSLLQLQSGCHMSSITCDLLEVKTTCSRREQPFLTTIRPGIRPQIRPNSGRIATVTFCAIFVQFPGLVWFCLNFNWTFLDDKSWINSWPKHKTCSPLS